MSYHHRYKPRDFDFSQRLVTLRKRTGLTQEEVAVRVGVTEKAIRNWEGGSHYPSSVNLQKLIELFLDRYAFASGRERDDARVLWDQLRERSTRHIGGFDEQWFAALFNRWQAPGTSHTQPGLPEQPRLTPPSRLPRGDWSEAIDVSALYGRADELAELERWLLVDQCRLVAVLGMGGIGKTALAVKLVQQIAHHFDCVLWSSLHSAPSLAELLQEWLPVLAEQHDTPLPQGEEQSLALLIKLLQERRCLLVLDNLETLFREGMLEGRYREGYEGYARLIQYVAETTHQSCLVLTSREILPDLGVFTGRQTPVRVFRLEGLALLASQQMLQEKGLSGDHDAWNELVQRYAGNPLALKIVAETVRELFGGDIAAFLAEGFMTFHGLRRLLTQQFERLSALEQALMYWLAIEREPLTLEALREDLLFPAAKSEVIEAMHSLRYRSLVERAEHGAVFTLQPVVLEYVTERLVALVSEEIRLSQPVLLLTHALLRGQARDYIRISQARLILQPVLDRLKSHLGAPQYLEELLEQELQQLRALPRAKQGYGGGNVINLLVQLNGHVKGKDCSQLAVWQAALQDAEAQDANFSGSDLAGSVFMDAIDSILSVALSPNGQYVAGGSMNGEIRLWRATDGQPLLTVQGHVNLVWSLVFNPESTRLISGGYDGLVKVWEVSSGQCLRTLQGHTKWVRSLAFHPAGNLLATCSLDRSIRLWDLTDGRCLKIWQEQHSEVRALACSPDGRLLASGQADGVVKLWDLASEQCLWSGTAHGGAAVPSLAFSPEGELLVSGGEDASIQVWEVSSGTQLGTLQGHASWVWSLAFGPHGLLASGSQDGAVKLWQINRGGEGGKCLRTLQGYSRQIDSVALSPDGRILVSGEHNGRVRIWETTSGQCLRILPRQAGESWGVAFSPGGQLFATSSPGNVIKIWDAHNGRCLKTLQGHQGMIWSLAWSPDGRFLVSGGDDTTVKWWEVSSGHCLATLQGHSGWVWSLACSPDGTLLASGDVAGVAKLWEIGSGRCLRTLQGSPRAILALTFTPDGTRLLSSNEQDHVTVWDVKSGQCLKTVPGTGETYWLGSVTLSADGSLLAAASSDRAVKVWDAGSGELLRTFPCSAGQPLPVALGADRRLLATGTDEGTIMLWELQTGTCLMTLQSERPYERMNISGATGITEAQRASLQTLGAIHE